MVGDALAQFEVDSVRVVYEQPHPLRPDLLRQQHLDLRLSGGKTALDVLLDVALSLHLDEKKVGCEAHPRCGLPAADEVLARDEYSPGYALITSVTGPSLTSSTAMRAPKRPPCASRVARTRSTSGSATSGLAASTKLGRLPLRVSP